MSAPPAPPDLAGVPLDCADQIQAVLQHVQRSILILWPRRVELEPHFSALQQLRDRLEETFTRVQVERLRSGELDFQADVDKLAGVVSDLEAATARTARAREIIGYVSQAVDLASQVVVKILPFL